MAWRREESRAGAAPDFCFSRVGVVEEVATAHYAATDEPIGAAVAQTSPRPRRAPH